MFTKQSTLRLWLVVIFCMSAASNYQVDIRNSIAHGVKKEPYIDFYNEAMVKALEEQELRTYVDTSRRKSDFDHMIGNFGKNVFSDFEENKNVAKAEFVGYDSQSLKSGHKHKHHHHKHSLFLNMQNDLLSLISLCKGVAIFTI